MPAEDAPPQDHVEEGPALRRVPEVCASVSLGDCLGAAAEGNGAAPATATASYGGWRLGDDARRTSII